MEENIILYRYDRDVESVSGEWMYKSEPRVRLRKYPVIRETPGYYIFKYMMKEKKVAKIAKNSFAYADINRALVNYKKRCSKNLMYCRRNLRLAEIFAENAKTL